MVDILVARPSPAFVSAPFARLSGDDRWSWSPEVFDALVTAIDRTGFRFLGLTDGYSDAYDPSLRNAVVMELTFDEDGPDPSLVLVEVIDPETHQSVAWQEGHPSALAAVALGALSDLVADRPDREAVRVRTVERFIYDLLRDLDQENSDLRSALEEARIEAAFLRGQLEALSVTSAMGRRSISRAVLGVVGSVLLALTTGAAGGAAQAAFEHRISTGESGQQSVSAYLERCEAIQTLMED